MPLEKSVDLFSQLRSDAFRGSDLLYGCLPESLNRTEFAQEKVLAVLAYARAVIENTFADALLHQ